MYRSLKQAFMAGYGSQLGDPTPPTLGLTREAWLVGAYFMRAGMDAPRRVERGAWHDWPGGSGFAPCQRRGIAVDGVQYINVPCAVGTKTVRIG